MGIGWKNSKKIIGKSPGFLKYTKQTKDELSLGAGGQVVGIVDERELEYLSDLNNDQQALMSIDEKGISNWTRKDINKREEILEKYDGNEFKLYYERKTLIEGILNEKIKGTIAELFINPETNQLARKKGEKIIDEITGKEITENQDDFLPYEDQVVLKYNGKDANEIDDDINNTVYEIKILGNIIKNSSLKESDPGFLGYKYLREQPSQTVETFNKKGGGVNEILNGKDHFLITEYNKRINTLRELTAVKALNYNPYQLEKGGGIAGIKVGIAEYIFDADYEATSDERVQVFTDYLKYVSDDENFELSKEEKERWFDDQGNIKHKFIYEAGVELPFWVRLAGELAVTRKLSGTQVKILAEGMGNMFKASRAGKALGVMQSNKIRGGVQSRILDRVVDYQVAFAEELLTLEAYNYGVAPITGGERMSEGFAIVPVAAQMYNGLVKKILSGGDKNIINRFVQRINNNGLSTLGYPVKKVGEGATSAAFIQVGGLPEQLLMVAEGKMSVDEVIDMNLDPRQFAKTTALAIAMKGFSPVKEINDVYGRIKRDVNALTNFKPFRNKVKNSADYFGVDFNELKNNKNSEATQQALTEPLLKKVKEEGLNPEGLATMDGIEGYNPGEVSKLKTQEQVESYLSKLQENSNAWNSFQIQGILKSFKSPNGFRNFKKLNDIYEKSRTLSLDLEMYNFLEMSKSIDKTQSKINNSLDNLVNNRLNADDIINISQYIGSSELTQRLLQERGYKGSLPEYGKLITEDAVTLISELSNKNIDPTSKSGKDYISNYLELNKINSQIQTAEARVKKGLQGNETLEALKDRKQSLIEKYDLINTEANNAIQAKIEAELNRAIQEEGESGGKVIVAKDKVDLQNQLNKMLKNNEITKKALGDLYNEKTGEVDLRNDNVILKGLNLVGQKVLTTGEVVGMPLLVYDANLMSKYKDPTVVAHEDAHPFFNAVMRRLKIADAGKVNKFVNQFKNSLSTAERKLVEDRYKESGETNQIEYFNKYMELVNLGIIKPRITKENMAQYKQVVNAIESGMELAVKDATGQDISLKMGVNAIFTFADMYNKALLEGKIYGPGAKAKAIDVGERMALFTKDGSQFIEPQKSSEYEYKINELKNIAEDYRKLYEEEGLPEYKKLLDNLNKEISRGEKNIATAKKNDTNIDIIKNKNGVYTTEEVSQAETKLIDDNMGAVGQIVSMWKNTPFDLPTWTQAVKTDMLDYIKRYTPEKGSLFNYLRIVNGRYTSILNNIDKGAFKLTETVRLDQQKTNKDGDSYESLPNELTDQSYLTFGEGPEPLTNRNLPNNLASENLGLLEKRKGDKEAYDYTSALIMNNVVGYLKTLEPGKYKNEDGTWNTKKFKTDFKAEVTKPANLKIINSKLDLKPTKENYKQNLKPVYEYLKNLVTINPQAFKDAKLNQWYELGGKMNVAQSIQEGVNVTNVKAGNKSYTIKIPTFDQFYNSMIDVPANSKNPTSKLNSKRDQISKIILSDISYGAVVKTRLLDGLVPKFNYENGKFNIPENSRAEYNNLINDYRNGIISKSEFVNGEKEILGSLSLDKIDNFSEIHNSSTQTLSYNIEPQFSSFTPNEASKMLSKVQNDVGKYFKNKNVNPEKFNTLEKNYYNLEVDKIEEFENQVISIDVNGNKYTFKDILIGKEDILFDAGRNMQDAKQETPDVVNIQEGIESIPDNFELTLASGEIINKSDIVKVSSSLNERGKLGEVNKENSPFFTINIETGELDADGKKIKEKVTFINEKAFNSYKSLSLELYKSLPSAGKLKGTGIKIDHLLGEDYRGIGGEGRQGVYVWKGRDKNGKPIVDELYTGKNTVVDKEGNTRIGFTRQLNIEAQGENSSSLFYIHFRSINTF